MGDCPQGEIVPGGGCPCARLWRGSGPGVRSWEAWLRAAEWGRSGAIWAPQWVLALWGSLAGAVAPWQAWDKRVGRWWWGRERETVTLLARNSIFDHSPMQY